MPRSNCVKSSAADEHDTKMETALEEGNGNSNIIQQCGSLIIATKYDPTATNPGKVVMTCCLQLDKGVS